MYPYINYDIGVFIFMYKLRENIEITIMDFKFKHKIYYDDLLDINYIEYTLTKSQFIHILTEYEKLLAMQPLNKLRQKVYYNAINQYNKQRGEEKWK